MNQVLAVLALILFCLGEPLYGENGFIYGYVTFQQMKVDNISITFNYTFENNQPAPPLHSTISGLIDKQGKSHCKGEQGCYIQTVPVRGNVTAHGYLDLGGDALPTGIEKKPGFVLTGHSSTVWVETNADRDGDIKLEEKQTGSSATGQRQSPDVELYLVRVSFPLSSPEYSGQASPQAKSIQGQVLNGKVPVRDAEMTLADPRTGSLLVGAVTIEEGNYTINLPADGSYILGVTAPGYAQESLLLSRFNGLVTLYGDEGKSIPIEGIPLSAATNGEGTGTIDSTRRDVYDPNYLSALPLGGFRTPDTLALLSPGVLPAPQTFGKYGPSLSPGIGSSGQFAVNGLRPRENNFTVDGSDNNDEELGVRRQGFVALFPQPIETLAEFQVITALPDGRFGRALGGQINALSRYSSRSLHLTAYGFGTGGALGAANFFDVRSGDYSTEYRNQVPITTDGTLGGPPVKFYLDPTYHGPIQTAANGYGFQTNPAGGKDPYSRAQAGVIVEGPIPSAKDTFFLASYERYGVNSTQETHFSVPTVIQRGYGNSGAVGFQPYVFDTGTTPAFPASLTGNAAFSLFPFPNDPLGPYGPNTYTESLPANARNNTIVASVDHAFSGNRLDHISVRVNQTAETSDIPSIGNALFSTVRSHLRTLNVAGYFDTKPLRNISNVFRSSFGRTSADFDEIRDSFLVPSDQFPSQPFLLNAPLLLNLSQSFLGFPAQFATRASAVGNGYFGGSTPPGAQNTESLTGPVGQVQILGFSPVGADTYYFPQSRHDHTIQVADTATGLFGRNVVVAGLDFRSLYLSHYQDSGARPLLQFGGEIPVFPPAQFAPTDMAALGIPTGLFQTLSEPGFTESPSSPLKLTQPQIDAFVQDYVRVGSRLHLSAGVRFENAPLPSGALGQVFGGFPASGVAGAESQCESLPTSSNFGVSPAQECRAIVQKLAQIFPPGFQSVFGAQSQIFSGRAGFAWAGPYGISVRGGWGLYNGDFPDIIVDAARSAFPNSLSLNSAAGLGNPVGLSNLASFIAPGTLNTLNTSSQNLLSAISYALALPVPVQPSRNLDRPYSMQTALTATMQLTAADRLDLAYVGTLGRHLLQVTSQYAGASLTDFVINGTAIYPYAFPFGYGAQGYGAQPVSSTVWESGANSSYNSLQIQFRHRQRFGLELGSAFTFSKSIDNSSDFFDTAGEYALPQDFSNLRAERGLSAFDIRLRFSVFSIWKVPLHGSVLRAWQISAILTEQSGEPYTVNSDIDVNGDGNFTDRLNSINGLVFNPNPNDTRILIAAPSDPYSLLAPPGQDGGIGRNTFTARGVHVLDASIFRSFRLKDRYAITTRAEAFNAFNSAEFGVPVRILEAPAFGTSVNTIVPARIVQLAIKFGF